MKEPLISKGGRNPPPPKGAERPPPPQGQNTARSWTLQDTNRIRRAVWNHPAWSDPETRTRLGNNALGKMVTPKDVVDRVVFLLDELSRRIDKTGKNPGLPKDAKPPLSPSGQNTTLRKVQALEKTTRLLEQLKEAASNWSKRRKIASKAQEGIEQLQVRLAGCSIAAAGWAKGDNDRKLGDYGWSGAFDDVKRLRAKYENLRKVLKPFVEAAKKIPNFRADIEPSGDMVTVEWDGGSYAMCGMDFHRAGMAFEEPLGPLGNEQKEA